MTTDILTLTQLFSPTFPVGAFAYSHGLEAAIADGQISDAKSLQTWLADILTNGTGRADAVLIQAAFASDDPSETDATARAFAASKQRLMETDLQGAAFCDTVRALWNIPITGLTYPVAIGHTAAQMRFDITLTTSLYLHAFASNLTAAAMRALPLGQLDGQRVIAHLKPQCLQIAQDVAGATTDDLFSNAWASDIAAMRHETLYSRTFRS